MFSSAVESALKAMVAAAPCASEIEGATRRLQRASSTACSAAGMAFLWLGSTITSGGPSASAACAMSPAAGFTIASSRWTLAPRLRNTSSNPALLLSASSATFSPSPLPSSRKRTCCALMSSNFGRVSSPNVPASSSSRSGSFVWT